jgi:predicted DNA-binding helix-hairpin-helix protein
MNQFPVDINRADIELIKRIPGIGFLSAQKIVAARKFKKLVPQDLQKMGIAYSRAKYFLAFSSPFLLHKDLTALQIKDHILDTQKSKYQNDFSNQLSLF